VWVWEGIPDVRFDVTSVGMGSSPRFRGIWCGRVVVVILFWIRCILYSRRCGDVRGGGATRGVEGQEALARSDNLIAAVERGGMTGWGFR